MTDLSGPKKNEILTHLKDELLKLEDFTGAVFKGYRAKITTMNAILIHLSKDNIEHITTEEMIHEIKVNILIKMVSDVNGDQEKEAENFINLVGRVEDALELISNEPPYWEHMHEEEADYTFKGDEAMVYHNCLLTLMVRKEWSEHDTTGAINA